MVLPSNASSPSFDVFAVSGFLAFALFVALASDNPSSVFGFHFLARALAVVFTVLPSTGFVDACASRPFFAICVSAWGLERVHKDNVVPTKRPAVVDAALPGDLAIADGFFLFVGISQGKAQPV